MTFLVVVLLAAVRASLLLRVDHAYPMVHHGLKVSRLYPAEVGRQHDQDLAQVAALLDSATGKRSSRIHADRLLRKLHPRKVHGSSYTFSRAPGLTSAWLRSHPNVVRVLAKNRSTGLLKITTIFQTKTVPDNNGDNGVTVANETGHRQKKSHFGGEVITGELERVRPSQLSHPIYLGIGQDLVDAAHRAYIFTFATPAGKLRKSSVNPVTFVGKRRTQI